MEDLRKPPRHDPLPPSLPPRGLCREAAAAYVGVSPTTFDTMVQDGRMPPPKAINARRVWDRHRLDIAFDGLDDIDAPKGKTATVPDNLPGWDDL